MDAQALDASFVAEEEDALSQMIDRYGQPLLRYCHHILCDYHEAQDAVQITFYKAYTHRARFQPGTNLSAWLYRLAYTTCVDLLRRRKRQLFAPPPAPAENTDYIGPELRQALLTLSAEERALIFGRVMEERSYEELAQMLGKSAATLRKRYERARGKLARALTK
ncbi:MAG TPA: sigma-70 family RNA polymerase sigma factor [Candidatus Flavonifractor merdigallinarum]|uniref:Sigma-70 family RNA polymerase sigma factor n=1 Tax=Candidatus Flavonifractor merdigallinarum TaxID=2838589 RepID=A0A9D2BYQ9_9FIRM|nr:sigma-70 family RNA polymerase sigma factor [Candidatus Flavonifractor merdigallinarum]